MTLAPIELLLVIDFRKQPSETLFERLDRHVFRLKVNIKQSAPVPKSFLEQAPLMLQACVERGSGKGSLNRDLNFEEPRSLDEITQFDKRVRRLAVEAEDKAAIDAYAP